MPKLYRSPLFPTLLMVYDGEAGWWLVPAKENGWRWRTFLPSLYAIPRTQLPSFILSDLGVPRQLKGNWVYYGNYKEKES